MPKELFFFILTCVLVQKRNTNEWTIFNRWIEVEEDVINLIRLFYFFLLSLRM